MRRIAQALTADNSLPPAIIQPHPLREGSRTYALDSFKKTYGFSRRRSLTEGSLQGRSRVQRPEFTRLITEQGTVAEGDEEKDKNNQANDMETQESRRIGNRKSNYYPTDAILLRHLNSGK